VKTNETNNRKIKVCLLGASFDTGNLGVSALAESSIKCIHHKWPDAEVTLLASGREDGEHRLKLVGRELLIRRLPIRFCKNVFLPNHFLILALYALLLRLLPLKRVKSYLKSRNSYLEHIVEMDLVIDITGGDSFSDLYGMRRFLLVFLCKWLTIAFRKKLVLLPQTYGPYNRWLTRVLARHILNHADVIYSRDRSGVEFVKDLLNTKSMEGKVKFLPDVAFVLDAHRPDSADICSLEGIRTESTVIVGLNVSGLLYHGGYSRNNMFGLKTDYVCLIHSIIDRLMKYDNAVVLLVPHVFPPAGYEVESDPEACLRVYEWASEKYKGRVFLARGQYHHNEIKYIIGLCDFFIGSRMHACIAALSQGIPAIGLAYSKKFKGVFGSVGIEQLVIDMRSLGKDEILHRIENIFQERGVFKEELKGTIPEIQNRILDLSELQFS